MKRWTGMLGVLLMTLLCTHALAVGGNNAVYQIIRHTETGEVVLGTAVAITDNCLITADTAICAAAEMRLVGEHEELTVDTVTVDRQDTGLAVITVTECITDILQLSVNPAQTGITIQTDGSEVKFTADAITRMQINQTYDGVALSVPENVLPGTVLLSEDGQLAGICVAFVGEGINRAAALTGKGIYALLVSGNGMNDADQQERV